MTYHKKKIERGVYGGDSKIREEYEEFQDALDQGNPIMALVELADLIGAIEGYTLTNYNITLADVLEMHYATKRAFESGYRKVRK
jgi:hypothetical protein